MVAARYGKSDPDMKAKGSKETRDKKLPTVGADMPNSARPGGISNRTGPNPDQKKKGATMSFAKGGVVEGGFRNGGMHHKRHGQ